MSPEPLATCRALSKTYDTPSGGIEALRSVDAEFAPRRDHRDRRLLGKRQVDAPSRARRARPALERRAPRRRPRSRRRLAEGAPPPPARAGHLRQPEGRRQLHPASHARRARTRPRRASGQSLLADVGLADRMGAKPIELSGGEQARAAFALALARETPLVVADEPTAELDRDSAALLLEAIRRHAGSGRALVVATHDPDVTSIADQRPAPRARPGGRRRHGRPGSGRRRAGCPSEEPRTRSRRAGSPAAFTHGSETVHAVRDASSGCAAAKSGSSSADRAPASRRSSRCSRAGSLRTPARSSGPDSPPTRPRYRWAELGYLPQRFGLIPELTARENSSCRRG